MTNLFTTHLTAQDTFEAVTPDWFEREQAGVRFLSERDFPITEDVDGPTDADWDFFAEVMWSDPAEREW